jgi:pimeloyl-ACP methyl ester carboxylesterase
VQNDIRRSDLTGDLERPLIVVHGTDDPIVSPGETEVYQRLVEKQVGVPASRDLLAVYYIPGMGHGGAEFDAIIGPSLDALEAWVDHRETGGADGSSPPEVLGSYPRAN